MRRQRAKKEGRIRAEAPQKGGTAAQNEKRSKARKKNHDQQQNRHGSKLTPWGDGKSQRTGATQSQRLESSRKADKKSRKSRAARKANEQTAEKRHKIL